MDTALESLLGSLKLSDKPVVQEKKLSPAPKIPIQEIAAKWIGQFNDAIKSKDSNAIAALFQDNGKNIVIVNNDRLVERCSLHVVGFSHISFGRYNQSND